MGKGGKTIFAAILAAGLLAGGVFAGLAVADPTTSDEYAPAVSHAQVAGADRDKYRGALEELTTTHDTLLSDLEERESAVGEKETEVEEAAAAVETREKAVGTAETEAAANTVSDGTWTVGEDIKPGTYRAKETVGSRCYWGVYRSGTNGSDIIDNDIPGGGKPTVNLARGQDFKSSNCGSWQKK
ncbi:hypothetical protein DQ353_16285 [Arthrobacter sp. AQ5-05]|nr:hypothetical protein DQ353_16285 [Arthrobacter sp. AQ5-05]